MGEILTTRSAPYDAEIEYLESTGTQWIGTDISVDLSEFNWTFDMGIVSGFNITQHQFVFGAVYSGDMCGLTQGAAWVVRPGYHNSEAVSGRYLSSQRLLFVLSKSGSTTTLLVNGRTEATSGQSPASSGLLCILGSNLSQYVKPIKPYRIYRAKSQNGEFDLIPVRVGQTGYMYDRVSQTLFGNQGSGNFVLGKDIHWTKTLNTRIKNRYDTEENWITENPILLSGETAFTDISGVHKCKVGDGETPYTGLPYVNNMDEAMIIRKWRD